MGKNGYDPRAEQTAAAVHELRREPIASPAECAESGDEAELVLLDELALRFQVRGLGAVAARQYARDALGVFGAVMGARDEACARAVGGSGAAEAGPSLERLAWLQAASWAWAMPDARAALWAVLFAHGQEPMGVDSMRKLAGQRGMSPENVNNLVEEAQRIFELAPRANLQKSAAARASYQRNNGAKK